MEEGDRPVGRGGGCWLVLRSSPWLLAGLVSFGIWEGGRTWEVARNEGEVVNGYI